MMYAKKSLGQHFLTSGSAVEAMIDAGEVVGDDIILEVGPGKGMLTKQLLASGCQVMAVEKDDSLFELLKEKFKKEIKNKKLVLIHDDILNCKLKIENYKLIANIPYNITGILIRRFLESKFQPERMVLMLQKEVAERIVAKNKKESILSISVKAYGEPKYIQMVRAGSFSPAPKVDSAILLIQNISKDFFVDTKCQRFEERFFELLRAGFKSKRKKLSSNLIHLTPSSPLLDLGEGVGEKIEWKQRVLKAFEKLGLDPNTRAEDVGIEIWQKLAREILSG